VASVFPLFLLSILPPPPTPPSGICMSLSGVDLVLLKSPLRQVFPTGY